MALSVVVRLTSKEIEVSRRLQAGAMGTEPGADFFSGIGSRGDAPERYVASVADEIERFSGGCRLRVVDLGCGDFAVGQRLVKRVTNLNYVGCDIVPELIEAIASFTRANG